MYRRAYDKPKSFYAQVTLAVTVGILASSGLSWRHAHRRIRREAQMRELIDSVEPPAFEYDVFISYSHDPENMEWVKRHVYEPLRGPATGPDGSKLKVFFEGETLILC